MILLMLAFFTVNAQQKQNKITEIKFTVRGNCESCKKRIENAADIKGVKFAQWDAKTQKIVVTFRHDKTNEKTIKEAILSSGHDVESDKAPDASYSKLPACCKFREGQCTENK